jgi:hypothetical protein
MHNLTGIKGQWNIFLEFKVKAVFGCGSEWALEVKLYLRRACVDCWLRWRLVLI